jgi:hypothetical protein
MVGSICFFYGGFVEDENDNYGSAFSAWRHIDFFFGWWDQGGDDVAAMK